MANDKIQDFAKVFQIVTGVSMEHAIDMELAGKHEELLMEVHAAIRNELRPNLDEDLSERVREMSLGANLPANFMDKFK